MLECFEQEGPVDRIADAKLPCFHAVALRVACESPAVPLQHDTAASIPRFRREVANAADCRGSASAFLDRNDRGHRESGPCPRFLAFL